MPLETVGVERLQLGMKVHLNLPWTDHPFLFSTFKIRNPEQLKMLRSLGVKEIQWDPAKSDSDPLPEGEASEVEQEDQEVISQLWEKKRAQMSRLKDRQERLQSCETLYRRSVETADRVIKGVLSNTPNAVDGARNLISNIVSSLVDQNELAINMVNVQGKHKSANHHSINVAVLSMVLGKRAGLERTQLEAIGMGALFHDLGKIMLPRKLLVEPKANWNRSERNLYKLHPRYGVDIANRRGGLSEEAILVIQQHHEHMDGSGYPEGRDAGKIAISARVVAIANRYDNLCNADDPTKSISPFEALSYLYSKQRQHFDKGLLQSFITTLGIYPPGTIVILSDNRFGMVLSVNPEKLLNPSVMVYEANIPRNEAVIVNLEEEEGLRIVKGVRASKVPDFVVKYLNPGLNTTYYFDAGGGS
jgi:putative nucleotidyltransferase with HDIG domain